MEFRVAATIFLLLSAVSAGFSQIDVGDEERKDRIGSSIVNDSTEQIYGPETTRYTYERNIRYNNPMVYTVDTSVIDLHRYQPIAQTENLYQDLGNIGTAMSPIYPQVPDQIGATSGFNIYDFYFKGPEQIRQFDTQSPHSRFGIIWGGKGRSVTEAMYTRNIDERSNFGFDFRGLFIDKQIQRQGRGDRHVQGIYYTGFANYRTKNGKYQVLGNFIRNRHKADEYGGILVPEEFEGDPFFNENRLVTLQNAETDELRTNYHLYHQYKINDFIQLFHSFDRYKQQNDFLNVRDTSEAFFDFFEVDSAEVKDRSKIITREHQVGVKGDIGKTFYSFYYKRRHVDFNYKYFFEEALDFETNYIEDYAGFDLRFGNDSLSYISASGEYMTDGMYRVNAEIRNSFFYAEAVSARHLPSYIQRAYRGSYDVWRTGFDTPISSAAKAGIIVNYGPFTVVPSGEYSLLTNYIYFRKLDVEEGEQSVLPVQASGDISMLKANLDLSVDFLRHFNFKTKIVYANVSGGSADALSLPEYLVNGQLAYANIFFNGNLELQTGVDVHYKADYHAQGYDPAIMQFYRQDEFLVESFPVLDVFINGKVNRGKFFLKVNNIVERFTGKGYFLTPDYPAQRTILDFGFYWAFYD